MPPRAIVYQKYHAAWYVRERWSQRRVSQLRLSVPHLQMDSKHGPQHATNHRADARTDHEDQSCIPATCTGS